MIKESLISQGVIEIVIDSNLLLLGYNNIAVGGESRNRSSIIKV